jgi:dihydrofolate reductase
MSLVLIAAVARNGVIGRDNELVWRDRDDLQRFKRLTLGHVLMMGRRTYDSIGRPLPGRTTIVVTRRPDWSAPGVTVAHSFEEALKLAEEVSPGQDVYVAGGGEIYRLALPLADRLELTEIAADLDGDTTFPAYDRSAWTEATREQRSGYAWVTYARQPGLMTPATGSGDTREDRPRRPVPYRS